MVVSFGGGGRTIVCDPISMLVYLLKDWSELDRLCHVSCVVAFFLGEAYWISSSVTDVPGRRETT